MSQDNPQVPWTDEQWARANQVIQDEANRSRVAATFLPLYGPLPADTDFVRKDSVTTESLDPKPSSALRQQRRIKIEDRDTIKLAGLQVDVFLRSAQMADPNMSSALQVLRRAANVIARVEDAIVFRGQQAENQGPPDESVPGIKDLFEVHSGQYLPGLWDPTLQECSQANSDKSCWVKVDWVEKTPPHLHWDLITAVSQAISVLEGKGEFGPFAVVLGDKFFLDVQTPSQSLVLPQDRIIPFLGGGPLRRSSTLQPSSGVVVALGGAPIELVVAADLSLRFLQVTSEPLFVFRLYEKVVLRIKEAAAIVVLKGPRILQDVAPSEGAAGTPITISGEGFGDEGGNVYFRKSDDENSDKIPADIDWNDNTITVIASNELAVNETYDIIVNFQDPRDEIIVKKAFTVT